MDFCEAVVLQGTVRNWSYQNKNKNKKVFFKAGILVYTGMSILLGSVKIRKLTG